MSWQRRILRVDLTQRRCTPEPLNMEWAKAFLGSRGLGTDAAWAGRCASASAAGRGGRCIPPRGAACLPLLRPSQRRQRRPQTVQAIFCPIPTRGEPTGSQTLGGAPGPPGRLAA